MVKEVKNQQPQKSALVKCLIVFLTLIVTALLVLFISYIIKNVDGYFRSKKFKNPTLADSEICETENCIRASSEILQHINPSVNPCHNFHSFACGNFVETHHIQENVTNQLNSMIVQSISKNDSKVFIMQKMFYQSCMDTNSIEKDRDQTLLGLLHQLGDWPILKGGNWNGSKFDWIDFMIKSRIIGLKFDWFLQFDVHEESDNNILRITIPKYLKPLGKSRHVYYTQLMTDVAVSLGAPKNIAHYETAKTVAFEDDLGNLAESHRNETKLRKMRISDIQISCPNINWLELINKVTDKRYSEDDIVIFDLTEYIKDLIKLLLGTSKRIQVDFMMWKLIEKFWPYLSVSIRERFEKYNQLAFNRKFIYNREMFCLAESKKQFRLVADSEFVRKHVTPEKQQLVTEITNSVKLKLTEYLKTAFWLNGSIKQQTMQNIKDISLIIGGPEEMFDEDEFSKHLGLYNFYFQSTNVLKMLIERNAKFYYEYYGLLYGKANKNLIKLYETVTNINFTYGLNRGLITIPASILQDKYLDPARPNYLNFAALGPFIVHKLFETVYNSNNSWWSTSPEFNEIAKCLLEQNRHIQLFDIKQNFITFLATEIAFKSYLEMQQNSEFLLPGLNYSPNQLFWIKSSILLCDRNEDSELLVFSSIFNSDNFGNEFNCPEGSHMNPAKKCKIL